MEMNDTDPRTLQEAIIKFANPDTALASMIKIRWGVDGPTCPHCQSRKYSFISTRRFFKCLSCKKQYTVKVGSLMEDSPLGLDKWLCAIWLIANAKNGISSYEIHRALGITQKSAWFLLHRIRRGMAAGTFKKLSGTVETDETYIGGLEKNKHSVKRRKAGRGAVGKMIVMGILQRGDGKTASKVRANVIDNTDKDTLQNAVKKNVRFRSNLYTDSHASYVGLNEKFVHETVNHSIEYVRGNVSTNGLENFFSLLKRTLHGTYVSCDAQHLFRYLDEQSFRFNYRKGNDGERFLTVAGSLSNKRLTYKELIGNE